MKSVMKHQFSQVPTAEIPRSSFERSHGHKTTFNEGLLIPFYVDEALPGDTFNLKATLFARMATPIFPIMDNLFMDVHYFSVPLRLVWSDFQKFCGEQENPDNEFTSDYLVPTINFDTETTVASGSILDYMGIPPGINWTGNPPPISALFIRAYFLIWNEWFRDQNLQDRIAVPVDAGPDDYSTPVYHGAPLPRGKRHDYFTSCLPWPQKGPGVELPLGGFAEVVSNLEKPQIRYAGDNTNHELSVSSSIGPGVLYSTNPGTNKAISYWGSETGLKADLSSATAATINSLREAFQLQKLFERDARGGTRYVEIIKSHFGTVSPDARLQRPEFLGGSTAQVNINPVTQSSATVSGSPQGNLAGFAAAVDGGNGFVKSFTEHCIVIGLVSVRGDLTYSQGIPRMFTRQTRYDFYWPALAHLGEQAVLNREIYADSTSSDTDVFGYQERWAEYRYYPSKLTGLMRPAVPSNLAAWNVSQLFASLPELGASFIEEKPALSRCVAVPSQPRFIFDSYLNLKCARPMPVYSVPGMIDHF